MNTRTGFWLSLCAAFSLSVGVASAPAQGDDNPGAYLAARQATMDRSFSELADYAARALAADSRNPTLLESAISANISIGKFDMVKGYAALLSELDPESQIAAMAQLTLLAQAEDYDGILAALDDGLTISLTVDQLMRAWALVGRGEMGKALGVYEDAADSVQGFETFGPYNKALALALVGDFEGGLEALADSGELGTRASILARVQMLSQLERNDDARAYLEKLFGNSTDPFVTELTAQLEAGALLPFDVISTARDGMADVFFAVASSLDGNLDDSYTLLYARIAEAMRPERAEHTLLVAGLLERLENYDLASAAYDSIGSDDLLFPIAELGRAEALRKSGKEDAEREVLKRLTETHGQHSDVHVAYGDALRRAEDYAAAAAAYTEALTLVDQSAQNAWPLFFTRGIAYERQNVWEKAEPDFRKALELQPDQPQVLNYLGYSFLEMKTNLDEAMEMIRRAAAARPQDGYITDSLAWGLFRLRRYEEAVEPMERAAALMPVDPIINDHLGDVYWAVGREREARLQWQRVLSFDPEEKELARIRRKLEIGLDAVLIEEGEEPTREGQ